MNCNATDQNVQVRLRRVESYVKYSEEHPKALKISQSCSETRKKTIIYTLVF